MSDDEAFTIKNLNKFKDQTLIKAVVHAMDKFHKPVMKAIAREGIRYVQDRLPISHELEDKETDKFDPWVKYGDKKVFNRENVQKFQDQTMIEVARNAANTFSIPVAKAVSREGGRSLENFVPTGFFIRGRNNNTMKEDDSINKYYDPLNGKFIRSIGLDSPHTNAQWIQPQKP